MPLNCIISATGLAATTATTATTAPAATAVTAKVGLEECGVLNFYFVECHDSLGGSFLSPYKMVGAQTSLGSLGHWISH